jgi:hypothetical protein
MSSLMMSVIQGREDATQTAGDTLWREAGTYGPVILNFRPYSASSLWTKAYRHSASLVLLNRRLKELFQSAISLETYCANFMHRIYYCIRWYCSVLYVLQQPDLSKRIFFLRSQLWTFKSVGLLALSGPLRFTGPGKGWTRDKRREDLRSKRLRARWKGPLGEGGLQKDKKKNW